MITAAMVLTNDATWPWWAYALAFFGDALLFTELGKRK